MNNGNILVFGAGKLQAPIISTAKELGYFVISIDPDINAFGKKISDKFFAVNKEDYKKTLEIATKYKIKGVISSATDKPLILMARIAKELNLCFPTLESIKNTIDKGQLKKVLSNTRLIHPKGNVFSQQSLPDVENLTFPLIIKPTKSSGSRGVFLCDNKKDYFNYLKPAFFDSQGEILIEEYIEGDEISVEAIVFNGVVHIFQVTDKTTTPPPHNVEISHAQPSIYKNLFLEKIKEYLQLLIDELKIDNCALHPEFKIRDNSIYLIELGPRLGGDYITSKLVPLSTGMKIEKEVVKMATGAKINKINSLERAVIIKYFCFKPNVLIKSELNQNYILKKHPEIYAIEFNLKKGNYTPKIKNSLDRYGYFIVVSKSMNSLKKTVDRIEKDVFHFLTN